MKVFAVLLLGLLGLVFVAWLLLESDSTPPFWAFVLLALFSFYLLFMIPLNLWYSSVRFARRRGGNFETVWEFSGQDIKMRSELGESKVVWKYFLRVIEVRDGFLFYPMKDFFHWLPFSAFDNPECVDKVRSHIVENGVTLVSG